jgi:hypothetical protein
MNAVATESTESPLSISIRTDRGVYKAYVSGATGEYINGDANGEFIAYPYFGVSGPSGSLGGHVPYRKHAGDTVETVRIVLQKLVDAEEKRRALYR